MTIGKEEGVIGALASIGVKHQRCAVDETLKIVSTPAYMLGSGIKEVAVGHAPAWIRAISLIRLCGLRPLGVWRPDPDA